VDVAQALALGQSRLPRRSGLPDPRREASWLLSRAWDKPELTLRLEPDAEVPPAVLVRYEEWLERRAAGVPAHHLTRLCPFWGRDFLVSPAVLVPRPETELVVVAAKELALPTDAKVLDLGTGSGCIAVSLAAERPGWRVIASDLSLSALAVAVANVHRHRVTVELVAADLAVPFAGAFDLVTANLPYIPAGLVASLSTEVQHDPTLALDGGVDGLDLVRRLLVDLPRLLVPGGHAVLELGEGQAAPVADLACQRGLVEASRLRDPGDCERVLILRRG